MIIVNLTSTSSRQDLCAVTVWSLINQNLLPDRIDLWISKEPYLADKGVTNIPEWVSNINKIANIVNVRYTENTGPYRKIFPALKTASDEDILIYADDDVVYGKNWLKELLNHFFENECKYVVASRIRTRTKNIFGKYKSYNLYPISVVKEDFTDDFIITGVGGCVLMKKHIDLQLVNDTNFLKVAPKTDDLWISKLMVISGTKVVSCPKALPYVQEIQHCNAALNLTNTLSSSNGGILRKLAKKIKFKILGYLGVNLSNNDVSIKKIDAYFDK
ncbi:glycosyltransferase [Pectobacterium cacticida]|uniref:glycosyltransferase n=1 Tax=Pectobacterium cacticida TaxID=69221 RepID=UPI002FEEA59B